MSPTYSHRARLRLHPKSAGLSISLKIFSDSAILAGDKLEPRNEESAEMKVRTLSMAICLCFMLGNVAAQIRDNLDPPPTATPFPGPDGADSRSKKPALTNQKDSSVFPAPPVIGEGKFVQELQNYESGEPMHPDQAAFAIRLVDAINLQIRSGKQIEQIHVIGFADGEPNPGLEYDWFTMPMSCRSNDRSVDDAELALLRSCIMMLEISKELGATYAGAIIWEKRYIDEPDGGKSGYSHRKTRVQVIMR